MSFEQEFKRFKNQTKLDFEKAILLAENSERFIVKNKAGDYNDPSMQSSWLGYLTAKSEDAVKISELWNILNNYFLHVCTIEEKTGRSVSYEYTDRIVNILKKYSDE